jgi:hypothetical protein
MITSDTPRVFDVIMRLGGGQEDVMPHLRAYAAACAADEDARGR